MLTGAVFFRSDIKHRTTNAMLNVIDLDDYREVVSCLLAAGVETSILGVDGIDAAVAVERARRKATFAATAPAREARR